MYRWTEGDGCNIEPDLELSQFDIGEIKINTTTTDINKGKQIFSDEPFIFYQLLSRECDIVLEEIK